MRSEDPNQDEIYFEFDKADTFAKTKFREDISSKMNANWPVFFLNDTNVRAKLAASELFKHFNYYIDLLQNAPVERTSVADVKTIVAPLQPPIVSHEIDFQFLSGTQSPSAAAASAGARPSVITPASDDKKTTSAVVQTDSAVISTRAENAAPLYPHVKWLPIKYLELQFRQPEDVREFYTKLGYSYSAAGDGSIARTFAEDKLLDLKYRLQTSVEPSYQSIWKRIEDTLPSDIKERINARADVARPLPTSPPPLPGSSSTPPLPTTPPPPLPTVGSASGSSLHLDIAGSQPVATQADPQHILTHRAASPRLMTHLSERVQAAKNVLGREWKTVNEASSVGGNAYCDFEKKSANITSAFRMHASDKITSHKNDLDSFKAMLKVFKATHPAGQMPRIFSDQTRDWIRAFKEVYAGVQCNSQDYINPRNQRNIAPTVQARTQLRR